MITTTSCIKTQLVSSDDGEHTYSITKSLENVQGEKAVIVLMYPTRNAENINGEDTTISHLIAHMQDLNLSEITIINLFSKVVKTKLSSKGLEVDEENMQYIENEIMKQKDFKDKKFILAYGSSMQSCKACTESKEIILKLFKKHNPKGKMYQLATESTSTEKYPHPLWLGIRCKFSKWFLKECDIPCEKNKSEENPRIKESKSIKGREMIKLN